MKIVLRRDYDHIKKDSDKHEGNVSESLRRKFNIGCVLFKECLGK